MTRPAADALDSSESLRHTLERPEGIRPMKASLAIFAPLALAALALPLPYAPAGGQLPPAELGDFAQTKAKSFDDFAGRAVLIEFFAYW